MEDLNGRHKQPKNNFFKKFKLEKPPILRNEEIENIEKQKAPPEPFDLGSSFVWNFYRESEELFLHPYRLSRKQIVI